MEGHGGAAHLVISGRKKSQLQHLIPGLLAPVACWLAPRYITLAATPRSNIRSDTPRWIRSLPLPPPPPPPCNHDHHDPRQKKKKNPQKKKLWHLRCSSLSLTVSSLFWSMLSIIIIIIRFNRIQDTICHRLTWFKRLVCTSHHPSIHPAIPCQSSPSPPPPSKGPDLDTPLPTAFSLSLIHTHSLTPVWLSYL
ncbi:hypothetical protein LY76DRAFT_4621 [Colletotrichum caudatum]|nr:hypothetical protein LY76DRAFT_4621 [Colletotrichum caudatum]